MGADDDIEAKTTGMDHIIFITRVMGGGLSYQASLMYVAGII